MPKKKINKKTNATNVDIAEMEETIKERLIEKEKKALNNRLLCHHCGINKIKSDFYTDKRNSSGYSYYCKKCLCEMTFDENGKISRMGLIEMLKFINRPYVHDLWLTIKDMSCSEEAKIGNYIRLLSREAHRDKGFEDSDPQVSIGDELDDKDELIYDIDWGGSFTKGDLTILKNKFDKYQRDFNLKLESDKDMGRKIAKASLMADKCYDEYSRGNKTLKDYKDACDTFDKLSKSANFSASERKNEDFTSFSALFLDVEKNIWIPEHKPLKKDDIDILLDQFAEGINRNL